MKKFIVLGLFGLLIMAFSATAYAIEFKASGSIDWDTVWERNIPFYFGNATGAPGHVNHSGIFNTWSTPSFTGTGYPTGLIGKPTGSTNRPAAYNYTRGTLFFNAIVDPNLSGTFAFEIDALRWGQFGTGTLTQASFRNNLGAWTTDQACIEVKNVYIDVGLPYFGIPVPMTVRVGAQPFGVRPAIMLYSDGMGITGGIKADPVMIIPMWAKIGEYNDWAADDADMYGLHAYAKLGKITIGAYGLYYNMNTYPLAYSTGYSWGTLGGVAASTGGSYGLVVAGTQRADFWWFGGYMDGAIGPINLNFDFVYDTGKVKRKLKADTAYYPDVKYGGWVTRAKVDFPWEKFNFGVVGMYASGADANKTSARGLPGDSVANPAVSSLYARKVGSYVLPPGSEQSPVAGGLNESLVVYSCFNAVADGGTGIANMGNYQQVHRGLYGGTWFAKLYGSAKLVPWYKVTLQGLYIGDTTKHGNTLASYGGNPRKAPYNSTSAFRDDNTIGWELDLINEFQIYKNLTWTIGGGYLWSGKALDVWRTTDAAGVIGQNFSLKNPWNITTRLLFTF